MAFASQQIILFLCIIYYTHANRSSLALGFLGPTNLPNPNTLVGGHPALFAFKLAIRDINNRSDLLPNIELTYVSNNTDSDVGIATVEAFWQCVYGNVIGIVGAYISAISQVKSHCIQQVISFQSNIPNLVYSICQSLLQSSSDFLRFHIIGIHRTPCYSIPLFSTHNTGSEFTIKVIGTFSS